MVYFQTKNPYLGKFWRKLEWKCGYTYIVDIWPILRPFGIFHSHLVHFAVIWYIFPVLVCCAKKNLATPDTSRTEKTRESGVNVFFGEKKFGDFTESYFYE
jgi:hypothetical protein